MKKEDKEKKVEETKGSVEEQQAKATAETEANEKEEAAQAEDNENEAEEPQAETEVSAEDKVAELSAKVAELEDKNLRMMAEFQNFRQRTNREKLELRETAGAQIFTDLLSVIDDFERAQDAMAKTEDIQAIREGQDLIYNKFMKFLSDKGVKPIETKDQKFDTDFHEAITTFPAPTPEQKDMIIDCTQKGYMLGDKVLRHAKVVVGA